MSRLLFGAVILAIFVVNATPIGPRNLADVITGSWKQAARPKNGDHPQENVKNATITQRVDNFNPHNVATYEQRYFFINEHFQAGGPIFVIFNDLSPADEYVLDFSLVHEIARNDSGSVFLLENRFYGDSVPTANLSLENLQYLTVEQALVDAAHFVQHIKTVLPGTQNSPVVVVGSKHGASMAVWFRQKYPHLSVGAWASSAPLLALQNNQLYKENAGRTIRELAGEQCYNVIEAGFRELEAMANAGNISELHTMLKVCKEHSIVSDENMSTLFLLISEFFSAISTFRSEIPEVCEILQIPATPAEAVARVIRTQFEGYCVPADYDSFVELERDIEVGTSHAYFGLRQFTYQACTQLGGFSTSDSPNQPFGSFYPLAFFTKMCTSVLDDEVANHAIVHENQDRFNVEHGGLNPSTKNVIFTYGEIDPKRSLGITHQMPLNEDHIVVQIPSAGSSYDFYEIEAGPTSEIQDSKLQIVDIIRSWTQ